MEETCDGCDGPVTWVEAAYACADGCLWCLECGEGRMACPCGQELGPRRPRARALP